MTEVDHQPLGPLGDTRLDQTTPECVEWVVPVVLAAVVRHIHRLRVRQIAEPVCLADITQPQRSFTRSGIEPVDDPGVARGGGDRERTGVIADAERVKHRCAIHCVVVFNVAHTGIDQWDIS